MKKDRITRLNKRQAITYTLIVDGIPTYEYGSKCRIQKMAKMHNRGAQRRWGKRLSKATAEAYR